MSFHDESSDTVLNIQVLEHVFEPNRMFHQMCRVLRPGGFMIMLIPQTSALHMIPSHYYNFTRYWIEESVRRNHLDLLVLDPLGGSWSPIASSLLYLVFQGLRFDGLSSKESRRTPLFYLLFPLMILAAAIMLPICMLLGFADLTEAPNNHLLVVRKPHRDIST